MSTETLTKIHTTATAMGWESLAAAIDSGDSDQCDRIHHAYDYPGRFSDIRACANRTEGHARSNAAAAAYCAIGCDEPFETLKLMNQSLRTLERSELCIEPHSDAFVQPFAY